MFDTVCTLPLSADLFSQALHPKEPIVSVGLSTGHVQTFRLPSEESDTDDDGAESTSSSRNGKGHIDTMWRTRRHKGSCRCLGFGVDGEMLYSAGTDGLVKAAKAETGVVENKIAIPPAKDGSVDAPTIVHALSPQTLLLATDSSALHLYDLRIPFSPVSARPQQSHHPHDDYISSLTPLPPSDTSTSGFSKQWVTTGGTTLAVTDLRRGVLVRSEDQEEELVSSVYISGLRAGGTSRGEKVVVGGSSGVLTLWEKGAWDDQDERIYVQREAGGGESLETLAVVPDELGKGKMIAVGLGSGGVKFVRMGMNKVVSEVMHDETEGVIGLGFDVEGRMVSGGGQVVKVWHEAVDSDGMDGDMAGGKSMFGSDSDDSDDGDDSDDSDRESRKAAPPQRKKKKNKGKGGQDIMGFADID
ncbi:WD40 repeat domain-containing protein [Aspergillus novofumigatus IBT 16806]|uniref:WD repeat-containing protein JIP5 n=1 Tax=Aspergillus novofumigatus (strain IBT 16806) TaxID=1392255 RepID=A0A2I1CDH8_ASPN1|nr:WD repeat-containing protein jip5 [Aspergillus novofumigatus IBT 16806]PKX95668.1 WD repeat-containing protein jip5 [Aspergillus novofumigatus IBT 16806]